MPQRQVQPQPEEVRSPSWEAVPWLAQERVIEEPRRDSAPPLRLSEEHVVDAPLAGDSIRIAR